MQILQDFCKLDSTNAFSYKILQEFLWKFYESCDF